MVPQRHAQILPLLKVPPRRHRAAHPLLRPHRPVLLERARPLDRRLLVTRALEDLVGALLEGEVALGSPGLVGREVAVGFDDIVLDERVLRPAVNGEVAGAGRLVRAAISDLARKPVLGGSAPSVG